MKKNMTSGKAAPLTKHDSEAESLFCASMEESCKSTPSDRHCTSRTRVVRILNDSTNPSKRGAHAWLWWLFAEKKHAHHQSKSHLRVFRSGVAVAQWKEAFFKVDSKKPTRSPWMFWCFLRCAPPVSLICFCFLQDEPLYCCSSKWRSCKLTSPKIIDAITTSVRDPLHSLVEFGCTAGIHEKLMHPRGCVVPRSMLFLFPILPCK